YARPGDYFVIGQTRFTISTGQATISPGESHPLVQEQTLSAEMLQQVRFHNADQRIEVLGRLPELISGANSDNELFVRLVNLLLAGIPRSTAVAVVMADPSGAEDSTPKVAHWDRRDG